MLDHMLSLILAINIFIQAGHGGISTNGMINSITGFTLHTFLFVPYFAWRHSHHLHHKSTGSIERDENFVPATRSGLKIKPENEVTKQDYREMFEETPIFTLVRIIFMQVRVISLSGSRKN